MGASPEPEPAGCGRKGRGFGPGAGDETGSEVPMLTRERMRTRNAPRARHVLMLLLMFLLLIGPLRLARADAPSVTDNADASRTLTWGMNNTSSLTLDNATLGGGVASLPWIPTSYAWGSGADFSKNGTADANLTIAHSGITLAANWSNRIADGDFSRPGAWVYENGSGAPYRVNATRDRTVQAGLLQQMSRSTEVQWNSMDSKTNWMFSSSTAFGQVYNETSGQQEGKGMLAMNISSHPVSTFYADAVWNLAGSPSDNANWSAFDRVVLWIDVNGSLGLSFNLSVAKANTPLKFTSPPQPLAAGWHQVAVDLNGFISRSNRSNLSYVSLRINGPASLPPNTWVYFDDVRVANSKVFDSAAEIFQNFPKSNVSSALPGSAYLAFDWCACSRKNVSYVSAYFSLVGPTGSYAAGLPAPPRPAWVHHTQDVSALAVSKGTYNLSFGFHVLGNDTGPSNATFWIDNATFLFPDSHNGTYQSIAIPLGADSQVLAVSWAASQTPPTGARLSVRTGNGSSEWNAWQSWILNGTYVPSLVPGDHFQIRVELNTTNASSAPVFRNFSIQTRSHPARGTVESDPAPLQGRFLRWRSLVAQMRAAPAASVTFWVGNGSYWVLVPAGGNLSVYSNSLLRWKAVLSTSDGVVTPTLALVRVTYEYIGSPVLVAVSPAGPVDVPSGATVLFRAVALDEGNHTVPGTLFDWHTTDPSGNVVDGLYVAGQPGTWNLTAVAVGLGVSRTVRVTVTSGILASVLPFGGGLAIAAALGFAGYELVVRRMFAIDDVFLIAKDGRLIVHNTRRMRADRDEDILSGMLTAIMAFLRDQDPEENGELKRFEVGGKTTLLERGEHVYLTAIYSGRVPGWAGKDLHRFMTDLEAHFGRAFANWSGSPEDLHGLKEFTSRFVSHVRYHRAARSRGRAS